MAMPENRELVWFMVFVAGLAISFMYYYLFKKAGRKNEQRN